MSNHRFIIQQLSMMTLLILLFTSCGVSEDMENSGSNVWKDHAAENSNNQYLEEGRTFLSIYTQIYIRDDKDRYDLTATVSLHNPNSLDSIYIDRAVFYNTEGEAIRTYFALPIFIRPMETLQLVIPVLDNEGGTGANFIFEWRKKDSLFDPLFEAVMVSSRGNHGISFITEGKRLQ